jgi:hypothetical protein
VRIAAVVEIVRAAIAIQESLAALAAQYRVDMTGATVAALAALAAKHGVSTADLSAWVEIHAATGPQGLARALASGRP